MKCDLCKSSKNDPLRYGKFLRTAKVKAHYYCVLLSDGLAQNGEDNQGMLGFLVKDVLALIKSSKNKKCVYCKMGGATQKCCKCPKMYHLPCMLDHGGCSYFQPHFTTFCHKHYRAPKTDMNINYNKKCVICLEKTSSADIANRKVVIPPCCKKNIMHKSCILQLVDNSAYYSKCPMCQDSSIFQKYLSSHGILIEHRDSTWNDENINPSPTGNEFTECNALQCFCPKGRNYIVLEHPLYDLVACFYCGAEAAHMLCLIGGKFICKTCTEIFNKQSTPTPQENLLPTTNNNSPYTPAKILSRCQSRYGRQYRYILGESPLNPSINNHY